ncbi:MAG: PH domain-containing protein [Rhodospirillales bacterium]|nr:PH domain-containing protein [Alphaproteobacteria bacterium]MCB9986110.1 PH domain-containing protein [Rhodospirillales bacterium]USO07329.1 MAG: PH domain-containing protein [Rhodospirillales bacterium]
MSYIEQSISPGEKVVHIGRFHWIYLAGAVLWIVLGVVACAVIIGGALAFDTWRGVQALYPGLPGGMFWQAWGDVIAREGGYVAAIRDISVVVRTAGFVLLLMGFALFAHMMVVRATTEIAVTTTRFVLKEGILSRHVDEMNIDRIESVHVVQSVLGRMLDFGTIMVRGMGIGEIILPPVARPIVMRNAIEYAREHQPRRT